MALLESERIALRALEPEDLELLYKWENNSDWWQVSNTVSPYSRYVLKEYIAESHRPLYETRQLRLMIVRKESRETIGTIDLFDLDIHHLRAGLGILIDSLFQGKGYGEEALRLMIRYAFSFLKLHSLYAHVPTTNEASRKLFSRCSFSESGLLNDWICSERGFESVAVMQLLNR